MNPAIMNSQFIQVALPIIVTFIGAAWLNNRGIDGVGKRLDDFKGEMNRRFDEVNRRFDQVNLRFDRMDTRIDTLTGKVVDIHNRVIRIEDKLGIVPR